MFENNLMSLCQFTSKKAVRSFLPDRFSVVDHSFDCIKALPLVWDVKGFKDVREGGIITTDPHDGSLQVKETLLLQGRRKTQIRTNIHFECHQCALCHLGREAKLKYSDCHSYDNLMFDSLVKTLMA